MEEGKIVKGKRQRKSPSGGTAKRKIFSYEHKLRAVKLYLEEQYPAKIIRQEMGMSEKTLHSWVRRYRAQGEEGLQLRFGGQRQQRVSEPVKAKIIELKKERPGFGVKRISQILRRIFFLEASPETVRKTLHKESLIEARREKRQKNISRPRFFERSSPNQLWQTDIFTFRLGGKNAYLIGYIDDYSRYMTGLGLFRSQTAEHVIEVFRIAAGEYRPPKEMLTDNGRQYTNWRGRTRFEAELQKERIKHIKSRPHHPMTLGKIERFWKTIFGEFLSRAQFGSFEEAKERLRLWVRYYNHKRPHQGIGGLCPADRYFEIQHALKKTMEEGIEENILEIALRGKPRDPFYMVGRLDGQNVVIRAEKGKVKMHIEGENDGKRQELEYNVEREEETGLPETAAQRDREMRGDSVNLERAAQADTGVPGTGSQLDNTEPVAGSRIRRDDAGLNPESESGDMHSVESSSARAVGEENAADAEKTGQNDQSKAQRTVNEDSRDRGERGERSVNEQCRAQCPGPKASVGDPESALRPDNGIARSKGVGHIAQELLRVGEKSVGSVAPDAGRSAGGTPCCADRCGAGAPEGADSQPGAGERDITGSCGGAGPAVTHG